MSGTSWIDWLCWIAGVALGVAGGVVIGAALFRDRAGGRKRCPKCWYDMSGAVASRVDNIAGEAVSDPSPMEGLTDTHAGVSRCPECGFGAKEDRQFLRTHRRWGRACVGVAVLALAWGAWKTPELRRGGWVTLVPTSVLVMMCPATDPYLGAPVQTQFGANVVMVQGNSIVTRGMNGVAGAMASPAPPKLTVADRLEMAAWSRLNSGKMARWQSQVFLERYLATLPIDMSEWVRLPDRWVAGEVAPVLFFGTEGVRLPAAVSIGDYPAGLNVYSSASMGPEVFRVHLPRRLGPYAPVPVTLWINGECVYTRHVSCVVEMVASAEEVLSPVGNEAINEMIALALDPAIVRDEHGTDVILRDRSDSPLWDRIDFGLGYVIEVVLDGTVVGRGTGYATWERPVWKDWNEASMVWEPGGIERVLADPSRAGFIVKGDMKQAFESYKAWPFDKPRAAAWVGTFETPVRLVGHRGIRDVIESVNP